MTMEEEGEESGCSGIATSLSESLGCEDELFSSFRNTTSLGLAFTVFSLFLVSFFCSPSIHNTMKM